MALTATIAVTPTVTTINESVNAAITVSNSGGSPVNIVFCQLKSKLTGSTAPGTNTVCATSQPVPLIGQPMVVPAGGSVILPGTYIFFAPSLSLGGVVTTYDCGGTLQTSDGSVFNIAPAATVQINPLPQPVQEQ
jgi:hypothetical protein